MVVDRKKDFFLKKVQVTQIGCRSAFYFCIVKRKEAWVSGRNQCTANAPNPLKVPQVRILLLPQKMVR